MNSIAIPLPFDLPEWSPEVKELMRLVVLAHQASATNNACISSYAAINGMAGAGEFSKACAGAMLTIGGRHAPVAEARALAELAFDDTTEYELPAGMVPGYGNSFFPEGDPVWLPVEDYFAKNFTEDWRLILVLTDEVQVKIKSHLKPNAAMWTAIACIEAGIPEGYESLIFLLARAPAWAKLCMEAK